MYIHQSFRVWCEESDIMAKQELYQFDPGEGISHGNVGD